MASRTGPDGLLALLAKTASASFMLALAMAASLTLFGCGGGDSNETSAGTSASAQPAGVKATSSGEGNSSVSGGKSNATTSDPSRPAKGGSGSSTEGGHGHAPIAPPKGPKEPEPTPAQLAHATVASMSLESPVLTPKPGSMGVLPATYTCDGKDSWPALRWGGIPEGTAELALFAMNVQPVEEKLFFDWAVAGLDPSLTGVEAGTLPKGAIIGQNGFGRAGYSICPSGSGETYMFALYALPQRLSPERGFDPRNLRKEVLQISGNVGLMPTAYLRG